MRQLIFSVGILTGAMFFPLLVSIDHTNLPTPLQSIFSCTAGAQSQSGSCDSSSAAPETILISYPDNPTTDVDAVFEFECNQSNCRFDCRFNSGIWYSCTSPTGFYQLDLGCYTFDVQASSATGQKDPSPETYSWEIKACLPAPADPTRIHAAGPETKLEAMPPDPSDSPSATFTFSCDQGNCTYECQLDFGAWRPCSSPTSYPELPEAGHAFAVRARDVAGILDPTPAIHVWTINLSGR